MKDPLPENISGEKQVQHVVKHSVDWGHVALGIAAIYAMWKLGGLLQAESDEGNDEVPAGYTGD